MKETTVVWAKLFLALLILGTAKPLSLKGFYACKHLGNNSCLDHSDCCSGFCYKEPGQELGVCKKPSPEVPVELNVESESEHAEEEVVFEKGVCGYYSGKETTANGDFFDESDMTAAHATLPFDTVVKVETMGSTVAVKINDRKSATDGQVLLLTRAAAENINIFEDTGPVPCQLKMMEVGCIIDYAGTCVKHYECCSQNCFREMFSNEGFCLPK